MNVAMPAAQVKAMEMHALAMVMEMHALATVMEMHALATELRHAET